MNKKYQVWMIAFLTILLLPGCSHMRGDDDELPRASFVPSTTVVEFDNQPPIKKALNSFLSVDGKPEVLPELSSGKADRVYVDLQSFDSEMAVKLLFGEEKIIQRKENTGDFLGEKVELFEYTSESGKELYNGLGKELHFRLSVKDPLYNVGYLCWDGSGIAYNLDRFSTTEELGFCTRQEAAEKVKTVLHQLNVSFSEDYQCYALNHNILKQEEAELLKESPNIEENYTPVQTWDETYDSYVFFFQNTIDSIPVSQSGYGDAQGGNLIYNNKIRVIYNRKGVIELSINNIYQKSSTESEQVKMITAEQALETVVEPYDKLISVTPLVIRKMTLEYIPTLYNTSRTKFLMTPAWRVWVQDQNNTTDLLEEDSTAQERIVDAVTGELIQ